jgi:hypothetical protein
MGKTSTYLVPAYEPIALTPEVVDPRLADVEAVARWSDYAFELPGGFRFGLAGLIGLIPGIGDILDALVSLYILLRAMQLGVPRVAVARMVVNIGIESLVGAVPFAGDMFDVVFKANKRNYQILQRYFNAPRQPQTRDWLFVGVAFLAAAVLVSIPVLLLILILRHI